MSIAKSGNGKATGKIILVGEHSVVYGKPAIALPFHEASIEVQVFQCEGPVGVKCIYHNGRMIDAPKELAGLKKLIEQTLEYLHQPYANLFFEITSSLPTQRGLGSSAAVAVAVVRSIYDYFNLELSQKDLYQLSFISEKINHGHPSGLDSTTISLEKAIYFEDGQTKDTITMDVDGVLVIADTGRQGNTAEAIREVHDLMAKDPALFTGMIERLGHLTQEVSYFLKENALVELGRRLNEAQYCLKMMGVSDEGIDVLIQVARNTGALGAKLTGSGKGGCILALCADDASAAKVSAALEKSGAMKTWMYPLREIDKHDRNSESKYQYSTY